MARLCRARQTFAVGFEGDAYFDERRTPAHVARHLGTDITSPWWPRAADLLETLLHHHDEPFGDSLALPTYLVAREARPRHRRPQRGRRGQVFAGYDWAALLASRILRCARFARGRVLPEGAHHHAG